MRSICRPRELGFFQSLLPSSAPGAGGPEIGIHNKCLIMLVPCCMDRSSLRLCTRVRVMDGRIRGERVSALLPSDEDGSSWTEPQICGNDLSPLPSLWKPLGPSPETWPTAFPSAITDTTRQVIVPARIAANDLRGLDCRECTSEPYRASHHYEQYPAPAMTKVPAGRVIHAPNFRNQQ